MKIFSSLVFIVQVAMLGSIVQAAIPSDLLRQFTTRELVEELQIRTLTGKQAGGAVTPGQRPHTGNHNQRSSESRGENQHASSNPPEAKLDIPPPPPLTNSKKGGVRRRAYDDDFWLSARNTPAGGVDDMSMGASDASLAGDTTAAGGTHDDTGGMAMGPGAGGSGHDQSGMGNSGMDNYGGANTRPRKPKKGIKHHAKKLLRKIFGHGKSSKY
ncbi:hypothetical protein CVT24_009459 [Panaeolus cyanescens]|uniref:Uncharacterized protein n=1 Tax=Panaeolus cyanescens TaxID=181874 RepID=A0A409W3L1_9AGAR|nr:hypothetical protein CVT24_009459 [Panaeolus cyanescens]